MMIVLRLVGFLFLLALGALFSLYLATGNRRYIQYAYVAIRFGLLLLVVFAAFYVVERFLLVV
jgi:asparagine N-glycosylation enzyme membrane subunit Stt3